MLEFYNVNTRSVDLEPVPKLDVLIVLGHNLSPWPVENVRHTPGHISKLTKLNVIAAGILCQKGIANNVIFSTGQTFGLDMPSEAYVMEEFWQQRYPNLAHIQRILEVESFDTAGNGEKSYEIARTKGFHEVGIISNELHVNNAITLFRRYGHQINDCNVFVSEQVLADSLRSKGLNKEADSFLQTMKDYTLLQGVNFREEIRGKLLEYADPNGKWLQEITKRTRR
jgi:hypothetical protein